MFMTSTICKAATMTHGWDGLSMRTFMLAQAGYPSKNSPAAYWHYHPLGRELYGVKYEHFHIWFGATI